MNELVDSLRLVAGRFVADLDQSNRHQVAVVGHQIAEQFRCAMAEGQVAINGRLVRIIGQLAPKGQMLLGDFDGSVLMPLSSAEVFQPEGAISHRIILLLIKPGHDVENVRVKVDLALRALRNDVSGGRVDYEVVAQSDLVRNVQRIRSLGVMSAIALASVGLVIAVIGLANSIFASVVQRTTEIGLRRCVGARRRDIRRMFVAESFIVLLLGVVAGVTVAIGATYWLLPLAGINPVVSMFNVVFPVGFSSAFGLLAAVGPADYAARLDPVVALQRD